MLDQQTREKIALVRFSLISPVVNGQVENQTAYFQDLTANPIEMPHYGERLYSPSTVRKWLSDYRRFGFDSLKPGFRSDRGSSRKMTLAIEEAIQKQLRETPRMKASVLYEALVHDGIIEPSELSRATFYRYLSNQSESINEARAITGENGKKERRRFSYANVNDLWQSDVMFGPHIQEGGKKNRQTYLIAFIDDASRLPTYSAFFYEQDFLTLRQALKEAVARRGRPRMLYTDNGKIFRSQQLSLVCAAFGCSLVFSKPYEPEGRGKIERFFRTVRERFLNAKGAGHFKSLEQLNTEYSRWLETDYLHKAHSSLGKSPLEAFLEQADSIKMITDPRRLDELFYLRVHRKVGKDATIKIEKKIYETDMKHAGLKVEVRYEPSWIGLLHQPLHLYLNDVKIGQALLVDFQANAHRKRDDGSLSTSESPMLAEQENQSLNQTGEPVQMAISFAKMDEGGHGRCSPSTLV